MFAQGRDIDRNHVEPVVEVFAKRSVFERGAQVAIGGSDQPHVDLDGARAAQALEFALLQHAEKFDLDGGRHVSDFIEKESAFVGEFEFARLAGGGSGEGPFFVAEEFALQKILGDRRAVDFDEGTGSAARFFVDGAGDEVFAHSAFAAQQNGGVGGRNAFDGGEHFLHFGTDRDDVGMAVLLSKGFAKRAVLFAQAGVIEFLVHHHPHLDERERLEDVIAGAGFHRLNRCLNRAERGHDDYGQRGILLLGGLQKFEPVDAREF